MWHGGLGSLQHLWLWPLYPPRASGKVSLSCQLRNFRLKFLAMNTAHQQVMQIRCELISGSQTFPWKRLLSLCVLCAGQLVGRKTLAPSLGVCSSWLIPGSEALERSTSSFSPTSCLSQEQREAAWAHLSRAPPWLCVSCLTWCCKINLPKQQLLSCYLSAKIYNDLLFCYRIMSNFFS